MTGYVDMIGDAIDRPAAFATQLQYANMVQTAETLGAGDAILVDKFKIIADQSRKIIASTLREGEYLKDTSPSNHNPTKESKEAISSRLSCLSSELLMMDTESKHTTSQQSYLMQVTPAPASKKLNNMGSEASHSSDVEEEKTHKKGISDDGEQGKYARFAKKSPTKGLCPLDPRQGASPLGTRPRGFTPWNPTNRGGRLDGHQGASPLGPPPIRPLVAIQGENSLELAPDEQGFKKESRSETEMQKANPSIPIRILQWNARSINSQIKVDFIKGLNSDLLCLQEIWQQVDNIKTLGKVLETVVRTESRGGGTATLVREEISAQVITTERINKDTKLIKARIDNSYMWICNLYWPNWSMNKAQKLFGKIRKFIPENEWNNILILGDFNLDANNPNEEDFTMLSKLCKQLGLAIQKPESSTRGNACLDFAITGSNIQLKSNNVLKSPSDHAAILWQMEVRSPEAAKRVKVPNKQVINEITGQLLKTCENPEEFFHNLSQLRYLRRKELKKFIKRPARNTDLLEKLLQAEDVAQANAMTMNHWKKKWEDIEETRYSTQSAIAYKDLRKITKYNLYEKRDGAVIDQIKVSDEEIVTDKERIDALLAETIAEIQIDPTREYIEKSIFPKLEPLTAKAFTKRITNTLSTGKATAFDSVSDLMFSTKIKEEFIENMNEDTIQKKNPTAKIFKNLWGTDLDTLPGFSKTWEYRLCPLNKEFPRIPTRKQMRPIMISGPILKMLETRFLEKLKEYQCMRLDRAQTGFVDQMGIYVNLWRAINRIQTRTNGMKKQHCYGLFIDMSNAYNMVPHQLLFEKLRKKNIFQEEEIRYLEQIYARIKIRIGKHTVRPNRGVAQGSIISPALFSYIH